MGFLDQRRLYGTYQHYLAEHDTILHRYPHYKQKKGKNLTPEEKARLEKIFRAKELVNKAFAADLEKLYYNILQPMIEKINNMQLPIKAECIKDEKTGYATKIKVDFEKILGEELYSKVKDYKYEFSTELHFYSTQFSDVLNFACIETLKYGINEQTLNELKNTFRIDLIKMNDLIRRSKRIFISSKKRRACIESIKNYEDMIFAKKLACKVVVEKTNEAVKSLSDEDRAILKDFICKKTFNEHYKKLKSKRSILYSKIEKKYSKTAEKTM